MRECDYAAYHHVNPNWPFGGHWFSKERFGKVVWKGAVLPWERATQRVVSDAASEPADTADPVDWTGPLMDEYLYWRQRFHAQGKQGFRILTDSILSRRDGVV